MKELEVLTPTSLPDLSDCIAKMPGSKRSALTTDDLMHMQEGPDRKRIRSSKVAERSELDMQSRNSSQSDAYSSGDNSDEGSSEEEGPNEIDPKNNDESEDGHDSSDEKDEKDDSDASTSERFNFSRITSKPRTQLAENVLSKPLPTTFHSLGISNQLQAALSSMSIRAPTEVQAACIPPLLAGEFHRRKLQQ